MKRDFCWFFIFLFAVFCLHTGAVLRKDNAVSKAQTDPILFKKKMEELKEGEKGPSMPKMELYARQDPAGKPVAESKESDIREDKLAELDEQAVAGDEKGKDTFNEYWWMEEGVSPQAAESASPAER